MLCVVCCCDRSLFALVAFVTAVSAGVLQRVTRVATLRNRS